MGPHVVLAAATGTLCGLAPPLIFARDAQWATLLSWTAWHTGVLAASLLLLRFAGFQMVRRAALKAASTPLVESAAGDGKIGDTTTAGQYTEGKMSSAALTSCP